KPHPRSSAIAHARSSSARGMRRASSGAAAASTSTSCWPRWPSPTRRRETGFMSFLDKIKEHHRLSHAMQAGVALLMQRDPDETSPKHLRVGINVALADQG